MKLAFLILTIYAANFKIAAQENYTEALTFAYSINVFQDVNTNDAEAISGVLSEHLIKLRGLPKVNKSNVVSIISDIKELKEAKTDLYVLLGTEYLMNQNLMVPYYSLKVDDNVGYEYLLITNKANGFNNLNDLQDSKIGVVAKNKISPTFKWIESIVRQQSGLTADQFFGTINFSVKANTLLLSVFFNELDACIISTNSYNLVSELNPQINRQITILDKSPRLLTGIICFNKNIIGTSKEELLISILDNLHKNDYGRQLLNLFSVDKLVPYDREHLESLIQIVDFTDRL